MNAELLNSFTVHLRNTLARAIDLAWELHQPRIAPLTLLMSLSEQTESVGSQLLARHRIPSDVLRDYLPTPQRAPTRGAVATIGEGGAVTFLWPEFSETTKRMITVAARVASEFHHEYVGTHHLLFVLLQKPDRQIRQILDERGIALPKLRQQLLVMLKKTPQTHQSEKKQTVGATVDAQTTHIHHHATTAPPTPSQNTGEESDTPALDFFGRNLTLSEQADILDPVVGREMEMERLLHVLLRRTKNNPVLIGDAGVGKTAIVEGLAKNIAAGKVPNILQNKNIIALDFTLLLAGTMYRGDFESRLRQIIEEVKRHPDIILFIDEIHLIVGSGGNGANNAMDAANIFKPALARGEIRCIGATTMDEYRASIESDPALARRFQSLLVREPSTEESVAILKGLRERYEQFHHVSIADDALRSAVSLSHKFLPERRLPDKAIDLLDEAGARHAAERILPAPLQIWQQLHRQWEQLKKEKERAIRNEQFQQAQNLKEQENLLLTKRTALEPIIQELHDPRVALTSHDVAVVLANITGIPLAHIEENQTAQKNDVIARIEKEIIGQHEAITAIAQFVKRALAGLTSPDRPLGSFLFLGPSGVGKTYLATVLADVIFGGRENIFRVNMAEFSESFHVSKLLGAPAGYVGYNEGVQFIEHVRRHPSSVIVFDEVEKAHPDIFNVLLQILDDGRLTDAKGHEINFRNSILIFTSNLGAEHFTKQQTIGFDVPRDVPSQKNNPAQKNIHTMVHAEAREAFPLEFFHRLHDVIMFQPLRPADLERIVQKKMQQLSQRLEQKKITLRCSSAARKFIAAESYKPEHGARLVEKSCARLIEEPLADQLLDGRLTAGDTVCVNVENKKIVLKKN